jgi:hypothetical protein
MKMNINILAIAFFVIAHVVFFAIALKESDNLRPDDNPEREAAILDYFRP